MKLQQQPQIFLMKNVMLDKHLVTTEKRSIIHFNKTKCSLHFKLHNLNIKQKKWLINDDGLLKDS